MIGCTDCHNNDEWTTVTGIAPRGPHASRYAPILERNYLTTDRTPESAANYDLCYKCHDRNALLADQVGTFPHGKHVVKSQASCATCHDAHGSRQNAHLINFMSRDTNGATRREALRARAGSNTWSRGPGKGTCYLTCHGTDHAPLSYPPVARCPSPVIQPCAALSAARNVHRADQQTPGARTRNSQKLRKPTHPRIRRIVKSGRGHSCRTAPGSR